MKQYGNDCEETCLDINFKIHQKTLKVADNIGDCLLNTTRAPASRLNLFRKV